LFVLASQLWVATVNGAWIIVITVSLFRKVTLSIDTLVDGANIVIFANNSSEDTLVGLCITSVHSAWVTIITSNSASWDLSQCSSSCITLVLVLGSTQSEWDFETTSWQQAQTKLVSITSDALCVTVL